MRVLIVILACAICALAQKPLPIPSPTPNFTDEQRKQQAESEKKQRAAEKLWRAKPSDALYQKQEWDERILLFLESVRPKQNEPNSAKMNARLYLRQQFEQQIKEEEFLIGNLVLMVDNRTIPFELFQGRKPTLNANNENTVYSRWWNFEIKLSAEEISLLRKSASVSVTWNSGGFELNQKGLQTLRIFLDEEIPPNET